MQDEKLEKSPVLILGSGNNIGLFLAKRFVADKVPVILSYLSSPDEVVTLEVENKDIVKGAYALEARSTTTIDNFFDKVEDSTDRLSAVINCIGPFMQKSIDDTSREAFDDIVYTNLNQSFHCAKRALPLLRKNGGGSIVQFTFAGVEKLSAYSLSAPYAAAKAGLLSLIRSMSVEWAKDKITVNSIAPGLTEIVPDSQKHLFKDIPANAPVKLEDIYKTIEFLLSDNARHLTGNNITVSGGFGWKYP